ncbi:ABC transporter substrate-binding protein [Ancylobacter defluvii]|uniref:ABC transporter substrate-binding protein n=2 Tax=Ancylobacter defluvii TaxID=1282440 RepID=A0A9W6JXJ6_9HYPH|nr:extracellular solute-binding protein [Ancylobacter defluvii]GLK84411.1 ABC transporter substrate-binding protein [Ancylobacter defluvii]
MTDITRRAVLRNGLVAAKGAVWTAACLPLIVTRGHAETVAAAASSAKTAARHGLAMHGDPLYPADFAHYASVNPAAPRGGRLVQGAVGAFDSLNPFIVRGSPAPFVRWNLVESLMARSPDEAFTVYGLLARSIETDDARAYVAFEIDERARFADGVPVTAADVLFSFELLRTRGRPNLRSFYGKVAKAEATGERSVRFDFAGADRELPLILGLMPILARHATDPATFEQTSFKAPLGSGPYEVAAVRPGESVTLRRRADYWGDALPVNRGLYNFNELRYDYYREVNGLFEAFKRGLTDIRFETDPGRWSAGYDIPAVRDGRILREDIATRVPKPYSALIFNMRRKPFDDVRIRAGMAELFDAEWANAKLYFGLYRRCGSFFDGSELSARGRPASADERKLLAPYPDAVLPEVMAGSWQPPASDGSGRDRAGLRRALEHFEAAGYGLRAGRLVSRADGRPLAPEVLVGTYDQERLALAWQRMLKRAGIELSIRLVDGAQFEARKMNYDYDIVPYIWDQSLSPGNEQSFYFGSAAADTPGTRNFMGLRSPAADAMIEALLAARPREEFVTAVRALDRVLISARFSLPLFHTPGEWLARWRDVERPATLSLRGTLAETWWQGERTR